MINFLICNQFVLSNFFKNLLNTEKEMVVILVLIIATLFLAVSINTSKKEDAVNSWPMFWFSMILIIITVFISGF